MNKKFLAFWALCCIIFLDGIGMGIIFPLLVPIYWDPHLSILPSTVDPSLRSIWYGVTLSAFSLGIFFSAPMLGDLSDGYGRKKILVLAVLGVSITYAFSAFAVIWKSALLLVISRLLSGLLSGCQPIAQAAAMDLSEAHEKAKHLSLIFFFSSAGFVAGPMLGSWLSNNHWVSWFNLSTPLFFAASACLLCCYLLKNFQETLTEVRAVQFRPLRSLYVLKEVWQNKFIRILLLTLFFYQVSWSGFFQIVSAFVAKEYHFTGNQIGYYSSAIGLGFAIAFLGSINYLSNRFAAKKIIAVSFIICITCLLLATTCHHAAIMWAITIPLGFFTAAIYVLISTIGSNKVGANYQGWFMGASMSTGAIAWFISPLINSVLLSWQAYLPLVFSLAMMITALLLFIKKIYFQE